MVRSSVAASRPIVTASRPRDSHGEHRPHRFETSGRAASTATGATIGRSYWDPLTGHSSRQHGNSDPAQQQPLGHDPDLRSATRPITAAARTSGPITSGTFEA